MTVCHATYTLATYIDNATALGDVDALERCAARLYEATHRAADRALHRVGDAEAYRVADARALMLDHMQAAAFCAHRAVSYRLGGRIADAQALERNVARAISCAREVEATAKRGYGALIVAPSAWEFID